MAGYDHTAITCVREIQKYHLQFLQTTYLDLASSAWVTGQLWTFGLFSRRPGRLDRWSRLRGEIVGIKGGSDAVHDRLRGNEEE